MNGSIAVIAVEMHPTTDKIVKVAHREFAVGTSKKEICGFMSQLNRTHTYVYFIGGGEDIRRTGFPYTISEVIDEYIAFPALVTKSKVNDWWIRKHPTPEKNDYELISACLCTDGTLVYCLHDLHFTT